MRSRPTALLLVLLALLLAGCGGDDGSGEAADSPAPETATAADEPEDESTDEPAGDEPDADQVAADARRPGGEDGLRVAAKRARIVVEGSDFGRVLFDANGQVVYAFEIDGPNRSNCTSEDCVRAWPPVLTEGEPTAGDGVDAAKLGTIQRDDGTLQVTYNGRPLYFYEHEGPREIRCHNVNLHGGLWWVVTPAGEPAD